MDESDDVDVEEIIKLGLRQEAAKTNLLILLAETLSGLIRSGHAPSQWQPSQANKLDKALADLAEASQPLTKEQSHDDADRDDDPAAAAHRP